MTERGKIMAGKEQTRYGSDMAVSTADQNIGKKSQRIIMDKLPKAHFDGPEYQPSFDFLRLNGQIKRIFTLMSDSRWRTLAEIAAITNDPEASISAQLRHLRKAKFGGHKIERRRRGNVKQGLCEYRLLPKN